MRILNLTQHPATPEQIAAGVVEPEDKRSVQALLTFNTLPSSRELLVAAEQLAAITVSEGCTAAMIGGAPFFMSTLERVLVRVGVAPFYAFSVRESVEETTPDGSTVKKSVFRHAGFVAV